MLAIFMHIPLFDEVIDNLIRNLVLRLDCFQPCTIVLLKLIFTV